MASLLKGIYNAYACLGAWRLLPCWFSVPWWTMPKLAFAVASLLKGMYNADALLALLQAVTALLVSMPW